jgi:hypothetical protein
MIIALNVISKFLKIEKMFQKYSWKNFSEPGQKSLPDQPIFIKSPG